MMRFISLLAFLGTTALHAQEHADCATAMDICKKQAYTIERTGGEGNNNKEADFEPCFMNGENYGQAEENSTWIVFEVAKSGWLTFTITPAKYNDDIDFVVYLMVDGTCESRRMVRCMAAGDAFNAVDSPCMGKTGLRDGEKDTMEDAGCSDAGDNTWLAPLQVKQGEKYALLVSNVSSRGPGFSISFSGSAKLPCDEDPIAQAPDPPKKKSKKVTPPPTPKPTLVAAKPPTEIAGRKVEVDEEVKVKTRTLKLRISDSQVEDGDVVSVYLDDQKVLDHIYLRTKPQEFNIQLPDNSKKAFFLTVFADSFGKSDMANTAFVEIDDGHKKQTIDLAADKQKQQSVKITVE